VLDAGALGGAYHAPGRDPVELLDRAGRLVADRGGEVHDGPDAAHRVAKGRRIGQIAERDLDAHAIWPEPAGIADEAADRLSGGRQAAQQRPSDGTRGTGQQEHAWILCPARLNLCPARLNPDIKRRNELFMAYVIAEPCIGTKDNSCVEVCPVDCIHPTTDEPDYDKVEMLYIDPEECIDCDACVEACPVDACFAEDQLPDEWSKFAEMNANYYKSK
jgi:NAD-dependent dihydropyrimidine dehydrogenase PreA subunit